MMTVRVVIPVWLARLRVVVDSGIHWSPVDRLLLWALEQEPRTPTALAEAAVLPPRLVNEIVFKLMRFGWAELVPDGRAVRPTMAGLRALHVPDGLPSIAWPDERSVRAVIEPTEGMVFAGGEVLVRHANDLKELENDHDLRKIEIAGAVALPGVEELDAVAQACLLNPDEDYVRILPERSRVDPRYVIATVHGKEIEGLPEDAPGALIDLVRSAAQAPAGKTKIAARQVRAANGGREAVTGVALTPRDTVLDGADHRELIGAILRKAAHRVVVHSTFLTLKGFEVLREDFRAAVAQGAGSISCMARTRMIRRARRVGRRPERSRKRFARTPNCGLASRCMCARPSRTQS